MNDLPAEITIMPDWKPKVQDEVGELSVEKTKKPAQRTSRFVYILRTNPLNRNRFRNIVDDPAGCNQSDC